jgi:hypothetical protein
MDIVLDLRLFAAIVIAILGRWPVPGESRWETEVARRVRG